jgi:ABC-type lipoprotein export system ATPase subunit
MGQIIEALANKLRLQSKDDIIIAIMGVTGAGKSTFISLLSDEKIEIGHGLQSCEFLRYSGHSVAK